MILVIEKLRLYAYGGFWALLFTGVILTISFADIDFKDSLLTQVYGFNNVCFIFDFPPSTYVLPALWAITHIFFIAYLMAQIVLFNTHEKEGRITKRLCTTLCRLKWFEAFTMCLFSTIFAVSPEGPDHTMWIHTLPWVALQVGLVSCACTNTIHGWKSNMWRNIMGDKRWLHHASIGYLVFMIVVFIVNQILTFNALGGMPSCVARENGTGWDDCKGKFLEKSDGVAALFRFISYSFFTCVAIVPVAKAGLFIRYKHDKLERVIAQFALVENKNSAAETDAPMEAGGRVSFRAAANAVLFARKLQQRVQEQGAPLIADSGAREVSQI